MAYSSEIRERAYQIWAFERNRNAEATAAALAEVDEVALGIADPVTARTIRNWVKEDNWHDRADGEVFSMAPTLRYRSQTTLALASVEAMEVLRDTLKLDPVVERHIVLKNDEGTYIETVMEFDTNIQKLRVQAAQIVADRTGFSPIGTRETGQVDAPPARMVVEEGRLREIMRIADPEARERELSRLENEARRSLEGDAPRQRERVSAGRIDRS